MSQIIVSSICSHSVEYKAPSQRSSMLSSSTASIRAILSIRTGRGNRTPVSRAKNSVDEEVELESEPGGFNVVFQCHRRKDEHAADNTPAGVPASGAIGETLYSLNVFVMEASDPLVNDRPLGRHGRLQGSCNLQQANSGSSPRRAWW